MTVIAAPTLNLSSFRMTLQRNDVESRSVFGSQSIEASTPMWSASLVGVIESDRTAMQLEAFLEALAGKRNQTEIYHVGVPEPVGTMRGVMTLDANAAEGAVSLVIATNAGQAGKTLLRGDLIGIGAGLTKQLIRVKADAVADGAGTITVLLNQALRVAHLAAAAVTWDKPTALFRQTKNNNGIEYVPGLIGQPWSLDLIEDWRS